MFNFRSIQIFVITSLGISLLLSGCGRINNSSGSSTNPLSLVATHITSSHVTLNWVQPAGTTTTEVYLAPEPSGSQSNPLPHQLILATLEGITNEYQATNLAPWVNCFFRVVTYTGQSSTSAFVHAKTVGGPRVSLDNPAREVHLFAPKIIQIIIASGEGDVWQAGPWTVKRSDGSDISVGPIYRHSYAIEMPAYSVGQNVNYSDDIVYADHQIFLTLGEAIGTQEILTISGPNNLQFILPFSDRYLESPVIKVNQVGYNPRASHRYAYLSGWMGDGLGLNISGADFPTQAEVLVEPSDPTQIRTTALSGLSITERSAFDPDCSSEVKEMNLSSLPQSEGTIYRIRIPGIGVSWRTAVSNQAAFRAYYVVMRGLFMNRWGGNLSAAYTAWSRPADTQRHVYDGTYHADITGSPTDGEIQPPVERILTHGYHDAGDFDQRAPHTVVPQLLMRAYEINPSLYTPYQLNIPKENSNLPDILEEALWGISGWEQLQGPDGGVHMGCDANRQPYGYYHANQDLYDYVTYGEDANTTARVAGIFAQASRLINQFDSARALSLRTKALSAYAYAQAKGASAGFMLYPAGELYRLTGTVSFNTDFQNYWVAVDAVKNGTPVGTGAFANFADQTQLLMGDYRSSTPQVSVDYILAYYGSTNISAEIKSLIDSNIPDFALNRIADATGTGHAYRNPRGGTNQNWGLGVSVNRFMDTDIAMLQIDNNQRQDIIDALSLCADYVLGDNPNGFTYITGLGTRHPEEPLHLDSLAFIKEAQGKPMPGIPVYGPVERDGLGNNSYLNSGLSKFYPAFYDLPEGLRYGDVRVFVNDNEFSVWEMQAPLAELFALLINNGMSASDLPANEGIDHAQNN